MPELPEVETIVRDLKKSLVGKTFSDVKVKDTHIVAQEAREFVRRLKGLTIESIHRRGKVVVIQLSCPEFLVIQLMMTGQLIVNAPQAKHTRVEFVFSDGSWLLYNDQRRFGRLRVVEDLSKVAHFKMLGPEPFSEGFTVAYIREAFRKTRRPVKNVLLDHTFVAGIGNIYACEILFRSRINPKRQANRMSHVQIAAIHQNIIEVLNEAIAHRGSSVRNYRDGSGQKGRFNERLEVYGRQGLDCPRCQAPVLRISQSARSTFYCGHCQK